MPLIWTQSWLDPNVELGALKEIKRHINHPLTVMLIAGGGDLPLNLLAFEPAIRELVCVDRYNSQLALVELKAQLCYLYQDCEIRCRFLEGDLETNEFFEMYQTLKTRIQSKRIWDQHVTLLRNGITRSDYLRKCFRQVANLPLNQEGFRSVFTNKQLIEYFGTKVLLNSLGFRFGDHFLSIINRIQSDNFVSHKNNLDDKNYFYDQMITGYYDQNHPPYLDSEYIPIHKLIYIQNECEQYLSTTKRKYELISLSNITDEMNNEQIDHLLQLVHRQLNNQGRVILRRMSGETELRPLVNKYFVVLDLDRDYLNDQTHLYREVILAVPRTTSRKE